MSANRKTIVVKFGTSTLTHGSPKLNAPHMVDIVRQIAQLHQAGFRVVTCDIRCDCRWTTLFKSSSTSSNYCVKTAFSCGRAESAYSAWEKLFAIYDIHIGQILLTRADIEDRERFFKCTRYITCGCWTIILFLC